MEVLFVQDRIKGLDGEAPARQPPTRSPSQHRATACVAACEMRAVQGTMCKQGCGGCARAVVAQARVGEGWCSTRSNILPRRRRGEMIRVPLESSRRRDSIFD